MKAHWDETTLTARWWIGPPPQEGDGLITRTGRKYLILGIRGKRLRCLILPPEETIEGRWFQWTWSPRRRA